MTYCGIYTSPTLWIQSKSWQEFEANIKKRGVEVEVVMKRRSSRDYKDIQGLRFTKDGLTFKASQIKRDLTFTNIVLYLDENAKKEQEAKTTYQQQARQNDEPRQEPNPRQEERQKESHQHSPGSSIVIPSLGLFDTNNPVYDPEDEDFRRRLQRKKKKRGLRI